MVYKNVICQNCCWKVIPNIPYWECDCDKIVDAFGHEGICPSCKKLIAAVQCPKCASIKPYSWWLRKDESESMGAVVLYATAASAAAIIQERAAAWIADRYAYFKGNPGKSLFWFDFFLKERMSEEILYSVMSQVASGNGFSLAYPVSRVGLAPVEHALYLLGAKVIDENIPLEGITETGITDEHTFCIQQGLVGKLYHFMGSDEY